MKLRVVNVFITFLLLGNGGNILRAQNIPAYVPTTGLVGWWPFNGNAQDESGNGHNGSISGATLTADRCGNLNKAFFFDGINDKIEVLNSAMFNFQANNSMSISYWIKPSSIDPNRANYVLCKQISGGINQDGWNSPVEYNSTASYRIQNGTGTTPFQYIGGNLIANNYYHVVFTYNNGLFACYINGNLINSLSGITAIIGDNPSNLLIGFPNSLSSSAIGFHGVIDDIGIWSKGLSDEEVLKLYNGNICLDFNKDCTSVNLDDFIDASSSSSGAPSGCFSACPNSKTTYYFTPKDSSSYVWEVIGGTFIHNSDSSSVEVTWSEYGEGSITIYETDFFQQSNVFSFCVDILDAPIAGFEFQNIQPCKNAPINLVNTTINGTDYLWDFGDGSTSTLAEPVHTYENSGTYTVILYASRNNLDSLGNTLCVCYDTISQLITINELPGVDIHCISTQCSQDGVYYWTSASNCQQYQWTVTDFIGQPVSFTGQGTDSIFVQWANGPFGTVSLAVQSCDEVYCSEPTSNVIDIIPSSIFINGKSKVCEKTVEVYYVPKWPTVDYNWQVTGGEIIAGQGTHTLTVRWNEAGPDAKIVLNFGSSFLGGLYSQELEDCAGSTSVDITVLKKFKIDLPTTSNFCVSSSTVISSTAQPWASYIWNITPSLPFSGQGSNQITVDWEDSEGNYTITATPTDTNAYCNLVDVKNANTIKIKNPIGVEGEIAICAGVPYVYTSNSTYSNVGFNWGISGGNITSNQGNQIEVIWNAEGPYSLQLNQYFLTAPGCSSDTISVPFEKIVFDSTLLIEGPSACVFDFQTYGVNSTVPGQPEYKWAILPDSLGTIVEGQGTDEIDIQWNGHEGMAKLTLILKACGDSIILNKEMQLTKAVEPEIVQIGKFCPGSTVQLDAGSGYSTYNWTNNDTTQLASIDTGGSFVVNVSNEFGCSAVSFFKATPLPKPIANITRKKLVHCIGALDSFVIRAAIGDGYKFRWFVDSIYLPTPVTQDTFVHYFTNQIGVFRYWIEVTDNNDCTAKSDTFFIYQADCSGVIVGGGGCVPQPHFINLSIFDNHPDCSTIDFDVTKSDSVTILGWQFYDPLDNINTGVYPDARHTFSETGCYLVEMDYRVPNIDSTEYCYYEIIREVRNPITAHFHHEQSCREFKFTDRSTFLRNKQPISWKWYFGDGDSSILKNPVHTYSVGGEFEVTLIVMNMDSCISKLVKKITVPGDPSGPIMASPNPACAGQPVSFSTDVEHILKVEWNFGNGTGSKKLDPTMTFDSAGIYYVSLFIDDTLGCFDTSFLELVVNEYSPLSVDTISWSPGLTVCLGDSVTLNAPTGAGFSYYWSNNTINQQLVAYASGSYGLTIFDAGGCKHTLDPVNVLVSTYPDADVSGNSFLCGNGCSDLTSSIGPGYSYRWFANGTLLPQAVNSTLSVCKVTLSSPYTVEVTNAYGCSTTSSPFTVEAVSPPEFAIQVTPAPCEGDTVQLSVMPVQPGVVYTWSTGAVDTSIQVRQKGIYVVTGVDSVTGCSAYAAQEVYPLPDLCYMPFGCYETCNPDTLFLPFIPGQDSVSWYYNGSVVSNHPSFLEVTQDGTYSVEVTTIHGCSDRSKEVSIDVVTGFGNLTANLWSDVNDNGAVDAVDTLLTGIPLQLQLNGVFIDTVASLGQVAISWLKLPESVYSVLVDTAQLPVDWVVLIGQDSVSIIGCDQSFEVNLLVDYVCPNLQTTVELSACEGSSADYQGTAIPAGSTQQFTYLTQFGCDSVVQVQVLALPNTSATLSSYICPGDTLFYQGVAFTGVATQTFQLTTQQGCDSTVLLQVGVYPTYSDTLEVAVCDGAQFVFQNTALSPGQSQQFTLQSVHGCDSIITVIVGTLPASLETLNVSTCPGEAYLYEGVSLQAGQSQTFQYTNAAGCDSLVLVQVAALPSSADSLEVSVCPGSTYTYQSVALSVGQSQLFSFTNTAGCDSTVMVQVAAYPSYAQTQEVFICPGETYTYQGQSLAVGQTQAFTFNTVNGCDSTLTVQVMASPSSSDTLEVSVCKDDAYSYGNQLINAGTSQLFEYSNVWGCDSSVLVQVMAYPELEYQYNSKPTCPNIQTGGIEVSVIGGPVSGLSYSLNGSVFDTLARFRLLEEGDYTVSVKDFNGCIQEEEVTITTYPPLEIVLPEELVIPCDSNQIEIRPGIVGDTTDLEFIWSNGSRSPSYFASDIGPVTVRAKNACRETAYKTTQIQWVDELRAPVPLYVPNIFSPAGQSPENSVFRTFFGTNFAVESYRLEVYDRFGSLVFVTEDVEGSWGGEFNNRPLGDGVYVWKLEATVRICGKVRKVERSGDVMIAR